MKQNQITTYSIALLVTLMILTGCGQVQLVATPNIYINAETNPYADVLPQFQSNKVDLFYITDRATDEESDIGPVYGYGRDMSQAWGIATIQFGNDNITWEQLVYDSTHRNRKHSYPVKLIKIKETRRLDDTSSRLVVKNDELVLPEKDRQIFEAQRNKFRQNLTNYLNTLKHKEIYFYVHGFNNTFEDATITMAQIWHFMGRRGLPIVYTWPAGHGGLSGYVYDRESGEFTIHHLKSFLKLLASCPELERINIIAHSRGTDVATTALRELTIELIAQGKNPQKELKIDTLILAAPDIDLDVARQRLSVEKVYLCSNQLILYTSPYDKAISWADWLMSSVARLGSLIASDLSSTLKDSATRFDRLHFVNFDITGFSNTHSYYYQHPAALSDLILTVRDGYRPEQGQRSNLIMEANIFWKVYNGYPQNNVPKSKVVQDK